MHPPVEVDEPDEELVVVVVEVELADELDGSPLVVTAPLLELDAAPPLETPLCRESRSISEQPAPAATSATSAKR